MSYMYQVSFNIQPDQLSQLEIGKSLEKVLGYMKSLLPNQAGFMDTRVFYTLNEKDNTYVVCISEWDYWEDLDKHLKSGLSEDKILSEFEPHIKKDDLIIRIYKEVD